MDIKTSIDDLGYLPVDDDTIKVILLMNNFLHETKNIDSNAEMYPIIWDGLNKIRGICQQTIEFITK